ncbi:MAG: hypothetical protein WA979_11565 [Pacificimonas sp.]
MRHFSVSCIAVASVLLLPNPASAVTIEAGTIETDGDRATVDLIYFSTESAGLSDIGLVARCFGLCDVITDEAVGMNLYRVNADGTPGSLIASAPGNASDNSVSFDDINLAMGDFVIAVGSFELVMGELPPFQVDTNVTRDFDYEVAFTGQADNGGVNCIIEGNLDGSATVTLRRDDALCALPNVNVPEPEMLGFFGAALLLGGALRFSRQV